MPAISAAIFKGIFAAATKSTNQTNKAGGTCLVQGMLVHKRFASTKQELAGTKRQAGQEGSLAIQWMCPL
jgi:hypothetical protein